MSHLMNVTFCLLLSSCATNSSISNEVENSEDVKIPANCYVIEGGVKFLNGKSRCMNYMPLKEFSGVYAIGFETSSFVEGYYKIPSPDIAEKNGIWVEFDKKPSGVLGQPGLGEGEVRFFTVRFRAHYSPISGQFGHLGASKHGMLVTAVIEAKEVK